jgi:Xaa-Pro aminopeptidase
LFSKCDCGLFFNTENNPGKTIIYLTEISCDFCILIAHPKKKPTLFISSLEEIPKTKNVNIKFLKKLSSVFSEIKKRKPKKVGLNFDEISKSLFDVIKKELKSIILVDVSKLIMQQRLIKNPKEINKLKKAINITEEIIFNLSKKINSFTYESQAIKFIQEQIISFGVVESFKPIVASGKNAANPHHFPKKNSKINKGFCIIDMGVKFEGYCADISRTLFIGTPTKKDKEFYEEILKELKKIEQTIKAKSKKFETKFKMIHALGHGIGLDVHESPYVGVQELKENMTIAIEPAKYTKNKGVRIEDDYLVTKNNLKKLSTSSQELKIINKK